MVGRNFEYGFVNKRENLLFVDKIFLYFQDSWDQGEADGKS